MDIEQLRQFDAIARCDTISAAAAELKMSQSALSRSIARLESELGVELLERNGKRISIGRDGAVLLDYARAILHEERLLRMAAAECANRTHAITVCTVAPAPLWRLTAIALEHFPAQILTSRLEGQRDVERDMMNGSADLGISMKPVSYPSVRCKHLMDERLSISVPQGHALAEKRRLEPRDLEGQTMFMLERVGFWADAVQSAFPKTDFVIQQDPEVLNKMAANPSALMFTSDAPYQRHNEGRVSIPLDDPCMCASFYLLVSTEATATAQAIFDAAISSASSSEPELP